MKYVKQKQICFNSGINYDDLENEINRLQIEHQSAEDETKTRAGKARQAYLKPMVGTKRNLKAFGAMSKKAPSD